MGLRSQVTRIRAYLRAGYPTGMPPVGYAPLVALLPGRLTNDKIFTGTSKLMTGHRSAADIGVEVTLPGGER